MIKSMQIKLILKLSLFSPDKRCAYSGCFFLNEDIYVLNMINICIIVQGKGNLFVN